MVGIDVVDLHDPLFKKRNSRALELILNAKDEHKNQENLFWLLWTAKEAIFKTKRELVSFRPKSIPISIKASKGKMLFYSGDISGQLIISADFIGAVCSSSNLELEFLFCKMETTDSSAEIREKLLHSFNGTTDLVCDNKGLPILSEHQPVSFTHHGRFGGYAYPRISI